MPDWTKSMQQSFEYYIVDPDTWRDTTPLTTVKSGSTISRDSEAETRGSSTINVVDMLGECYIRIYLITIQNGVTEKHPLATVLVQTPSSSFDGKVKDVTMDAYTPLLELKENPPPLGYSIFKGEDILDNAYLLIRENTRAPVVKPQPVTVEDGKKLERYSKLSYDFVANTDDTWLSYISDLVLNSNHDLDVDEMGRILFSPIQDTTSLQPVKIFDDSNSSILQAPVTMDHDLFDIPNVVEIIFTKGFYNIETKDYEYRIIVTNDDPSSPTSTVNRGRKKTYREIDPNIIGSDDVIVTKEIVQNYAERLLRDMSTVEYKITFTHGYYPIRLGDCVGLNYKRAGLTDIKAKVISQSIKCEPGCPVTETAVFTTKLWR